VFRPLLAVHSSLALYSEALRIQTQRGLSWYDSLIVSAAIQAHCDVLFTEDMQHGQSFGSLRITNPFL
jgi:predicted nucleic acid-binding protein